MALLPKYASSVPLVLNPSTGTLTAQFRVVFDDWFATVPATPDQLPDFNSDEWAKMFGDSAYQYPLNDDDLAQLQDEASAAADNAAAAKADSHRNLPFVTPLAVRPPPLSSASSLQRESVPIVSAPSSSEIQRESAPLPSAPSSSVPNTPIVNEQESLPPLVERESTPAPSLPSPVKWPTPSSTPSPPAPIVSTTNSAGTPVRLSTRTRRAPDRLSPSALGQYVAAFEPVPPAVYTSFYNDNGFSAPLELSI